MTVFILQDERTGEVLRVYASATRARMAAKVIRVKTNRRIIIVAKGVH